MNGEHMMPRISEMNEKQLRKLIANGKRILEARKDNKDVEYMVEPVYKGRGKNRKPTEDIDMLVAKLKGSQSASFTRLADAYYKALEAHQKAEIERNVAADTIKDMAADLWDDVDRVNQRLVATVSYGFVLTAETQDVDVPTIDYEGVVKDLITALDIQTGLLENIIKANTAFKKKSGTPERLREPSAKHKKWLKQHGAGKEQVKESSHVIATTLPTVLRKLVAKVKQLTNKSLKVIDDKLDQIREKLNK